MGDHPAQRLVGVERLVDGGVLGVIAYVPEEFDGELQLVAVDGVGAVGEVVGNAGEHIDVVVADVDSQGAVGGCGANVVVGGQVGQVVIVLIGEVARKGAAGAEDADTSVAAQEDRLVVEVAPQGVVGAGAGHHAHRVNA